MNFCYFMTCLRPKFLFRHGAGIQVGFDYFQDLRLYSASTRSHGSLALASQVMLHQPCSFWSADTVRWEVCKVKTMFQLLTFARVLLDENVIIKFFVLLRKRYILAYSWHQEKPHPRRPSHCPSSISSWITLLSPPKIRLFSQDRPAGVQVATESSFFPGAPAGVATSSSKDVLKRPVSPWVAR